MEELKLFNVGWDLRGQKPKAEHHFNTQYHQIGNMRVFAYDAAEAYDYALVELAQGDDNTITITIPFVEEIKSIIGVTNERETRWNDADLCGDWLKEQKQGKDNQFTECEICVPDCRLMTCKMKWEEGRRLK